MLSFLEIFFKLRNLKAWFKTCMLFFRLHTIYHLFVVTEDIYT